MFWIWYLEAKSPVPSRCQSDVGDKRRQRIDEVIVYLIVDVDGGTRATCEIHASLEGTSMPLSFELKTLRIGRTVISIIHY